MAIRRPLVIVDGRPRQLPAGDTLDAPTTESDSIELVNGGAATLAVGTPIYISASGEFSAARANAFATVGVVGLVSSPTIAAASSGFVQTDGVLSGTTAQWDAITGDVGGLVPGQVYFLDAATAGRLTATPPSTVGQFVLQVGRALSETDFEITITIPIEL